MADSTPDRETRPSLLLRIKDGQDQTAWNTFVELYAPLVYRQCRRHGLQHNDAEDVTQEVLSQMLRSAQDFNYQPDRGKFRTWLYEVTSTKVANHFRSVRRTARASGGARDESQDLVAPITPPSEWFEEFQTHVLRVALARIETHFEPGTWKAFMLAWKEARPATEVARMLDVNVDHVYVAKSRVLARLRQEVLALAEDLPVPIPPT
jgi:RNA polymerase sigma factor (sigma-70 family)